MDKDIILSGFTDKEIFDDISKRGGIRLIFEQVSNEELVDEVYNRDLDEEVAERYSENNGPTLNDASDEQIIEEFTDRELHVESLDVNLNKLYELIRTGKDYSHELAELIYEHTGRSL